VVVLELLGEQPLADRVPGQDSQPEPWIVVQLVDLADDRRFEVAVVVVQVRQEGQSWYAGIFSANAVKIPTFNSYARTDSRITRLRSCASHGAVLSSSR
jgi:hypothetical protein